MEERILKFEVWERDCDPYGHLNGANYLRYLEELATREQKSGSFLPSWMSGTANCWRPWKTYLEFLLPVRSGDHMEIHASTAKILGTEMLSMYEFINQKDGKLSAASSIHWTCVNPETGMPPVLLKEEGEQVPVDPSEEDPEEWIQPPAMPPAPSGAYIGEVEIEWRDINEGYRLRTPAFLDYCVNLGLSASRQRGWSVQRSQQAGLGFFVRKLWIEEISPIQMGQILRISSWLSNLRPITLTRHFQIEDRETGSLLGRVHTAWVCVNPNTGKITRYPEGWVRDFADQVAEDDIDFST